MRSIPLITLVLMVACGDDPAATTTTDAPETSPTDTSEAGDIDAAADSEDAGELEVDETPTLEPWQHDGPIVTAPAPAATTPLFVERTATALPPGLTLPEGRAMVVDFDVDGREDLVVLGTTAGMSPIFLKNETEAGGPMALSDWTAEAGFGAATMALLVFGDVDNDGDPDAFSGTSFRAGADGVHGIWLNDGAGRFTYLGADGLSVRRFGAFFKEMAAATLADLDGDGRLDLYVAMWNAGDLAGGLTHATDDELYKGDGSGRFARFPLPDQHNPLTSQLEPGYAGVPRRAYGLCPADYDDDGDLDLFVNNYGAGRPALGDPPHFWEWNLLWRNDGAMLFTDVAVEAGVHASERGIGGVQSETPVTMDGVTFPGPIGGNGFGCSWGDFDNDGDLDLVVGQIAHPDYPQTDRLMLHVNQGGPAGGARVFTEESAERGLEYYEDELHPVLVDIDLDGRLDLAVSRLRGGSKWEVYLQGADQRFAMLEAAESGVDIERPGPSLWLDVEGDGDLDLFMPKGTTGRLFENVAANGRHLVIELVGKAPRDATGARVTLATSAGRQVRELIGGSGHYNTQQTRRLHFGLGGDSGAEEVTIRWPDGEIQALGAVRADVWLVVEQGGAIRMR